MSDPKTKPRISVITPSYNQAAYIEQAILSVLSQGYFDLEYIVIDGGSTDGSVEIIKKYQDRLSYWVSEPDGGQADGINKGWRMATGDVIAYLNSDDLLEAGALGRISEIYMQHPGARLIYGDCRVINKNGEFIGAKTPENYTRETLLMCKSLPQPSVFISRQVLDEVGILDVSLRYALDWAFFLKVFWSYPPDKFVYVPHTLSMSREYGDTKSRKGLALKSGERRRVIDAYFRAGILPSGRRDLLSKALGATYWLQGVDEFLAGNYLRSFYGGATAFFYDPLSVLDKVKKISWLVRKRVEVKRDFS